MLLVFLVAIALVAGGTGDVLVGPRGPRGADGPAGGGGGGEGSPGPPGVNGTESLTAQVVESPGVNCADGGDKISSGLDDGSGGGTANDEVLQAGEFDFTAFTCTGADGAPGADGADGTNGYTTIFKSTAESPGINCADGGKKYESGLDNGDGGGTANNGVLEAGEVDRTDYVCNGADGADGTDASLKYTYDTGTSGDPGSGKFGFDTATLASIATLRISETDGDGNGVAAYIATWDDSTATDRGIVTVVGDGVPTRLLIFKITSAITDNGVYDSFSVTYITHSGSHGDEDLDRLWFSRSGDKGDTGSAGSDGNGFTVVDAITTAAFTTTSTTGSEVTALTNTLSSTGTYWFRYVLLIRTAATGTGIDFGVNFDSTNGVFVAQMGYQDGGSTASNGVCDGVVTGDGGEFIIGGGSVNSESTTAPNLNVITGVQSTTEDCLVTIDGIVATTASGELELWCATDVNTSQVDVRIGSSVVIIKTA